MNFYSHATKHKNKKKFIFQHIENILKISSKSFYPFFPEKYKSVLDVCVKLHDLGKYTDFFQQYLLEDKKNKPYHLHSLIGAQTAFNWLLNNNFTEDEALIGYFICYSHHNQLKDITYCYEEKNRDYIKQINRQYPDLKSKLSQIERELNLSIGDSLSNKNLDLFEETELLAIDDPNIRNYFTINYLFSLLIEGDKLDASQTRQYQRKEVSDLAVEKFIGKADLKEMPTLDKIDGHQQNLLRNYVRAAVLENLKQEDILEKRIFTLTAPTGIGKTLTSLDFALRLKKMIRDNEGFEPQIIYGLPFINIIEQGLKVYSDDVFKNEVKNNEINILGHYQYADVFGKDDNKSENSENAKYNQKLMSLNTWQADVVITSFVQFFETLISNRNKLLLKFNHLAGAIVILDEVQTLRLKHLPLLGAALHFLSKFLHTRIILMTATKPKIFELANKEILFEEDEKADSIELLKEHEKVFALFNRTKIIPLLENRITHNEDFYDIFAEKRPENKSCLVVCNTVQRSIDVFNELKENEVSPIYYLSTNIVPAARMNIIKNIKHDLANKKAPVLVSTQVVEAGVDLDFDMGFRDLAPIDSMVQVAGRINRENSTERQGSPLYVVEFEREYEKTNNQSECQMVYDKITRSQALKVLRDKEEIPENEYFNLVDSYFSGIAGHSAFYDARQFYKSMKTLKYDGDESDYPVSKFKIIEESPWAVSVFVELNEKAEKAREAYTRLLNKEIEKEEFDRYFKRDFNQYIIAVPKKFAGHLQNINEFSDNILLVSQEPIVDCYDFDTGFIRDGTSDGKAIML